MSRKNNPHWGKPVPFGPVVPTVTSFEEAVKGLKLQLDQYVHSMRLREWARRNKNSKFIPESLLQAWGFEITKQPFIPIPQLSSGSCRFDAQADVRI